MVTLKEREIIIEAIRVLRSRRVRPSARKIAWYVRREHLLSEATTDAVLDELVESEDVLRVEYKGATSYRVAASWSKAALVRKRPTRTKVNVMNSEATCKALRAAVEACGPRGASKDQIQDQLIQSGHLKLVQKLDVLLHREIRAGTLLRVETTHRTATLITYVVPADAQSTPSSPSPCSPNIPDEDFEEEEMEAQLMEEEVVVEEIKEEEEEIKEEGLGELRVERERIKERGLKRAKRGRPPIRSFALPHSIRGRAPSRRNKKTKKVFDPSEGGMGVGRKRTVYRCDVCFLGVNPNVGQEDLLVCHRCSARAHPSCLGYSAELAVKSRLGPWTCMDCKHCAICNMDHNIGTLIFCDECDRAYHLTCHRPPLNEQPQGSWICFACSPQLSQSPYDYLPGLPTPRDSPVPDDESRGSSGSWETVYSKVPSVAAWTVDQIIDYFEDKGFTMVADVFREQDIDGLALLMLTRTDVLKNLNFKLGPALKIYKQIRILQTRHPNPPLPGV